MINVIYIAKGKLIGAKVDERRLSVREPVELGWDANTFDIAMGQIVEKMQAGKVRILLDDAFSYLLRINVPGNLSEDEERKYISSRITDKIPEVLQDKDWDYKEIIFNISRGKDKDGTQNKEVIVFSPVKYLMDAITKTVVSLNLTVEAIEPVEISRTRNGNPLIGIALKEDIKGNDREVLNILIDKNRKEEDFKDVLSPENKNNQPVGSEGTQAMTEIGEIKEVRGKRGSLVKFTIVIIAIVIITIAGLFLYGKFSLKESEIKPVITADVPSTAPQLTVAPTPAEEVINLSQYGVIVKNGSGVAGGAQNASDILLELGFEKIDTGNADNYGYKETFINVSENIPKNEVEKIIFALNKEYEVATEAGDIGDSEYDLEIIVGKRK